MFKDLDPLLHSQLRLAIMALLVSVESANFNYLLEQTGATKGNLSAQITKLKDAGYLKVEKRFKDKLPETKCRITPTGVKAFEAYYQAIKSYFPGNDDKDQNPS